MSPQLTLILTFCAVTTAVMGGCSILVDLRKGDRARLQRRLDEASRNSVRERARKSSVFKDMALITGSMSNSTSVVPSFRKRLDQLIEQAGMTLSSDHLLAWCVGLGLVSGLVLRLLTKSYLLAGIGLLAGLPLPILYVKMKRQGRLNKLLAQLPPAFDLMGRVMRSGQSMSQAFTTVADQLEPPISHEFAYCSEQQNLGISTEIALRDLAYRTGLIELRILVVGVIVQQQTGGNMAEMLDSLSHLIRERYRMRGLVDTLTAEGRLQAMILLGLPPAMFLVMFMMNRPYAVELFDHPVLIGMTLCSEFLGWLWIRSIVNFTV